MEIVDEILDAEVFGLFRDLVPVVATEQFEELETVRARQGKVPDLSYPGFFLGFFGWGGSYARWVGNNV